jgi:hypothetical protein
VRDSVLYFFFLKHNSVLYLISSTWTILSFFNVIIFPCDILVFPEFFTRRSTQVMAVLDRIFFYSSGSLILAYNAGIFCFY